MEYPIPPFANNRTQAEDVDVIVSQCTSFGNDQAEVCNKLKKNFKDTGKALPALFASILRKAAYAVNSWHYVVEVTNMQGMITAMSDAGYNASGHDHGITISLANAKRGKDLTIQEERFRRGAYLRATKETEIPDLLSTMLHELTHLALLMTQGDSLPYADWTDERVQQKVNIMMNDTGILSNWKPVFDDPLLTKARGGDEIRKKIEKSVEEIRTCRHIESCSYLIEIAYQMWQYDNQWYRNWFERKDDRFTKPFDIAELLKAFLALEPGSGSPDKKNYFAQFEA